MTKAGLDDSIVIAKIKSSVCQFDTAPDTLIELKRSGVTAAILRAMTEAGNPPQVQTSKQSPSSDNFPTSYGYFLFDGARFQTLTPTKVAVVIGLSIQASGVGNAVDGFRGNSTQLFPVDGPSFLVYQQNVDISTFHLAKLGFVDKMQAGQFNMMNTSPQFFRNVYGTDYNQIVPVNLWRPQQGEVSLRTEPVTDRHGMFRLIPDSPLVPGKYALFSGQSIHSDGIMFTTRVGTEGSTAFYFEIQPSNFKSPTTVPSPSGVSGTGSTTGDGSDAPTGSLPGPNLGPAVCANEYNSCVYAGRNAMSSMDWQKAISDFQAAANLNPISTEPWLRLGSIYERTGQNQELSKAWNKAITLGGTVSVGACLGRVPKSCEKGRLSLNANSISFSVKGKPVFSAAPAEITPDPTLNGHEYTFQIAGTKYTFDFFPPGANCAYNKQMVDCPSESIAQQLILAQYVSQVIPKLSHGELGK